MGYPSSFEQFVVYEPWNPAEYRELRLIAKAIHGTVHLAKHLPTGELRAIKKIPNHNVYKRPNGQLENAFVEIGASLYLSHHAVAAVSGIIQTHGAFRDEENTYLITASLVLETLSTQAIARPPSESFVLKEVCNDLKAATQTCVCRENSLQTVPSVPTSPTEFPYEKSYKFAEFAAGGELFDEVARVGHISEAQARRIGLQLLLAVKSLHDNGVCHRDLSLENTLIHADGSIRVIDFGQAEPLFDDTGCEKYLENSAGKLYYRAPEMYSGAYRGTAADMFAAGVELFILVFGRLIEQMIRAEPSKRPSADEALAHPALTRCEPALDFTFLSCSTWFLPPGERGTSMENEIDFRNSALLPYRSAYRSYSNEQASAEQVKRANRALGERARSSIQQLAYEEQKTAKCRFHHSEGYPTARRPSGMISAQRQESLVQQVSFAKNQVVHRDGPKTIEVFSPSGRTPTSEGSQSAVSQNAYVKLVSSIGDSRCEQTLKSSTESTTFDASISYTFTVGQPLLGTSELNELQLQASIPAGQPCVDVGTPITHTQQPSRVYPSTSDSSMSVSPTVANFSVRASAPRGGLPTSMSPFSKISSPSARTPVTHPFHTCVPKRGTEKKCKNADGSAASDRFTQDEVKDSPRQDGERLASDIQKSGCRRRTGDFPGHSKQGRPSGWMNKGVRRSINVDAKAKRGESRGIKPSSCLPAASSGISSSGGGHKDKEIPPTLIKRDNQSVVARGEAAITVSLRKESVRVENPAVPAVTTEFYEVSTSSAKSSWPAKRAKATTAAVGGQKGALLQDTVVFKASGTKANINASSCRSAKLSAASGSPFSLRLRTLSLVLANRLTGFKFCRCSNQEQSTAKTKGDAAMADGRT